MTNELEFGVDWYPEQWDESLWADDARRMAGYGFSLARVMEFAWTIVEPKPGRFDFSLFDRAVEALYKQGIKAVIGTPTATPPIWLVDAHPDVLRLSPRGLRHDFGARRNLCYNAPAYRQAAIRVARAVAERFGGDPRVAGFQVDNEIGHEGSDRCACDHCRAAWHAWLKSRYGEAAAMNEAWGAVFWNTSYERFDQVPVPRAQPATGHNPGLLLDYDRFQSESAAAFAREQTEALRAAADAGQWVTTNLFPPPFSNAIDMEALTEGMDFASWDNYPIWGPQDEELPWQFTAAAESYVRGLRGNAPFTVMEEMSGFQGHVCLGKLPPEEQVALWSVQAIVRGANRIVFFRWRTAPFGQEQLCYGLLDADNQETPRLRALAAMMRRAKEELGGLAGQKLKSPVCLAYSKDDGRVIREQYLSKGLYLEASPNAQAGYDMEAGKWFAPYATFGINADARSVRSMIDDLASYRLVALPLYQMADPAVADALAAWVAGGGSLVLGYRAGTRDLRNHAVDKPLPGVFAELAGVRVPRFESLNLGSAELRVGPWRGKGTVWADLIELTTAHPAAVWSDKKKFYKGAPAAAVNRVGKGSVWYLGTSPDPAAMFHLYRRILKDAGLKPRFYGAQIERVARRDAEGREWELFLNHSPKARRVAGLSLPAWGWAKRRLDAAAGRV